MTHIGLRMELAILTFSGTWTISVTTMGNAQRSSNTNSFTVSLVKVTCILQIKDRVDKQQTLKSEMLLSSF